VGKILDTTRAYCDFCKDKEPKDCVESYIENWHTDKKTKFKSGFLSGITQEVVGFDIKYTKKNIHICFDCIKQLNQLLK
ncbi:MAG TPA: hypothetical protein DDY21_00310, partial [Candidatus Moranbacteria bacterium]|nr:hypothetical protein [Candidatus Moranbacteria bacterium]